MTEVAEVVTEDVEALPFLRFRPPGDWWADLAERIGHPRVQR